MQFSSAFSSLFSVQVSESYMSLLVPGLTCTTICSGLGCVCSNTHGADTLTITGQANTQYCFCGDFQVNQLLDIDITCLYSYSHLTT